MNWHSEGTARSRCLLSTEERERQQATQKPVVTLTEHLHLMLRFCTAVGCLPKQFWKGLY